MSDFVTAAFLEKHLTAGDQVIIDCRFDLQDTDAGRAAYESGHIPGAIHFDLDCDLSGDVTEHGGRHPLPDVADFAAKLGEAGVDEHVHVIVYDDQNWAFAGRLWWMLRYLGHDKVSVLDVPYSVWVQKGYPVSTAKPQPVAKTFTPHVRPEMVVDMNTVKEQQEAITLIDSRASERYRGISEPMDPVAGHIPGARHRYFMDNIAADGQWQSEEVLYDRFQDVLQDDVVVYCGSGVTATVNLLALRAVGKDAILYLGGWSDWSSYADHPVATTEDD